MFVLFIYLCCFVIFFCSQVTNRALSLPVSRLPFLRKCLLRNHLGSLVLLPQESQVVSLPINLQLFRAGFLQDSLRLILPGSQVLLQVLNRVSNHLCNLARGLACGLVDNLQDSLRHCLRINHPPSHRGFQPVFQVHNLRIIQVCSRQCSHLHVLPIDLPCNRAVNHHHVLHCIHHDSHHHNQVANPVRSLACNRVNSQHAFRVHNQAASRVAAHPSNLHSSLVLIRVVYLLFNHRDNQAHVLQ